jgi:hypothetical protein
MACQTATSQTVDLELPLETAEVETRVKKRTEYLTQDDNGSSNFLLVERVQSANLELYKSAYPSEAALASCRFVAETQALPAPTTNVPLFGTAYITATSMSTRTDGCRPDAECDIDLGKPTTSLGEQPAPTRPPKFGPLKSKMPNIIHSEIKGHSTLMGPSSPQSSQKPETRRSIELPTLTALPMVSASSTSAPMSVAAPTPAVTVAPLRSQGSFTLGSTVVPVSIYKPQYTVVDQLPRPLLVVGGSELATVGQTIHIDSTPVVIASSPERSNLVAIINPGTATESRVQLDDLVPSAGYESGQEAVARHARPITVGGEVFEALNEQMFLMPDGQELSIGGPSVTIGHHLKTTLGLLSEKGGNEVLVINGMSRTIGMNDLGGSATTTTTGHAMAESSSSVDSKTLSQPPAVKAAATSFDAGAERLQRGILLGTAGLVLVLMAFI